MANIIENKIIILSNNIANLLKLLVVVDAVPYKK